MKRALGLLLILASPVVIAIWAVPWFVTQDGPAHALSGEWMGRLIAGDDWLSHYVFIQWKPLPNFLAPAMIALLSSLFEGRFADRVMMTIAFAAPAVTIVLLRTTVRDGRLAIAIVPFAVLISLSRLWLLGFYSFLIGVALFNLTLAWWWRTRDRPSLANSAFLSLLLIVGWFAHVVSFGATIVALIALALVTRRNVLFTGAAMIPVAPLALWYVAEMRQHSGIGASYVRLQGDSLGDFLQYARSIKVLSIAKQTRVPFVETPSPFFALFAPAVLAAIAFLIWWFSSKQKDRAWTLVSLVFLTGAIVAPDGLGMQHGGFLRERLFLFGLIAAVPAFTLTSGRSQRVAAAVALAAVLFQSGFVWEYALDSNRRVQTLFRAAGGIPDRTRVYVVRPKPGDDFRASPILHAANLLGLGRDIVVWNNYQANLYFFPVNYRAPFVPCSEDGSCERQQYGDRIDQIVVWTGDAR